MRISTELPQYGIPQPERSKDEYPSAALQQIQTKIYLTWCDWRKNMDRRSFLGTLSGAAATAMMNRHLAWASEPHKISTIGIQLYTVRDALKLDYDGTLAQLAQIGYREVESGRDHDKPDPKEM